MRAVFVGRFQPFHKGHLKAIKYILKKEKKGIFIVIGSIERFLERGNPFSFKERKEMVIRALRESRIKNFKIFGVPDFFDDKAWASKVLAITGLKPADALVFSRDPWTTKSFEKIGVKVQPQPFFFNKLSATLVREKICRQEKWEHLLPKSVSAYLKEIRAEQRLKFLAAPPEKRIVSFIRKKVKEAGAKGGIVGVSGGVDSALTAILTKQALGDRCRFLSINFDKISLAENISLLNKKLGGKIKILSLRDPYSCLLRHLPPGNKIVKGNLKSRLIMAVLYYFANFYNLLVIGTTNRSEEELGYFTKFGDGGVDIEPISNLYKTDVLEMAKRLGVPEEIIKAKPSAGFWRGQTDEEELGMSYEQLDRILKLLAQGFKEEEISFLTDISKKKVADIVQRKRKNVHKLLPAARIQINNLC